MLRNTFVSSTEEIAFVNALNMNTGIICYNNDNCFISIMSFNYNCSNYNNYL